MREMILPPEERLKIYEMYRDGYEKHELAAMYGVSLAYITKSIYEENVKRNGYRSMEDMRADGDISKEVRKVKNLLKVGDQITVVEKYEQPERKGVVTGKYPYMFTCLMDGVIRCSESFHYVDLATGDLRIDAKITA